MPFKNESKILLADQHNPKPNGYQRLGLFVWTIRLYLEKHPVPRDVESVYMKWISRALYKPTEVEVHLDNFTRAFPFELRSSDSISYLFPID